MIISGIYQIRNTLTGDFYIGSSYNINERWSKHLYDLKNSKHHSKYLQRSWNKYGETTFTFDVLELCNIDFLLDKEQEYLDLFSPSYNSSKKVNSCFGIKRSDDEKYKAKQRGIEQWKNLSNKEIKDKTKHLLKYVGNKHSSEDLIKMSTVQKDLEIHRKNNNTRLCDIKEKMILTGDYVYHTNPVSKYSLTNVYIESFNSVKEACIAMNKKVNNCKYITNCCKNRIKSAYGYIWKYKKII